jgi:RNA polymerase sigma-70 factor (ECF subfamily)
MNGFAEPLPHDMEIADHELLRRTLKGDEASFSELYARRQGSVFRFVLHMTGNVPFAEDVTQEVFLALMESGRRFDASRGTLLSFLFGIARNQMLRKAVKERTPLQEPADEEIAFEADPLEDLTRRETIERVRRAVLSLPAAYREPVVLCDLEDLSYEDAAGVLDCPVGIVRSRLSRGRALLAKKLAPGAASATQAAGSAARSLS